jgi:hypothetical protein
MDFAAYLARIHLAKGCACLHCNLLCVAVDSRPSHHRRQQKPNNDIMMHKHYFTKIEKRFLQKTYRRL